MQICPSILESSPKNFIYQLKRLSPYFNYFQIDIIDGIYAPNKTVQIEEIAQHETCNMKHNAFDFHLMVKDYEKEIAKLFELSDCLTIKNILIHYSLHPPASYLLSSNIPIGLVLNSEDQVSDLIVEYDIKKISIIQIMTVDIGAQGNPFVQESLKKIEQLKTAGFAGKIFLDGGINDKTLPLILSQKSRPDVLAIGSFLTKTGGLKNRVAHLEACLRE